MLPNAKEIKDYANKTLEWLQTDDGKEWSVKWMEKHQKEERRKQTIIDNHPDAKTLYTYEINIDTLEIDSHQVKMLNYPEDSIGFANYEESGDGRRVYAESLTSLEDARQIVLGFCKKFLHASSAIIREIM